MELYELYPACFQALSRYAARLAGNRMSGEDVAQETFMRAIASAETLSKLSDGQQKSWLYTTARRIVIDQQRRINRAPPPEDEPVWIDDLTRLEVVQLLATLPAESAQIVRMRHFAGMNSVEIGRVLNLAPATVRTRLRSAITKLRKLIESMED